MFQKAAREIFKTPDLMNSFTYLNTFIIPFWPKTIEKILTDQYAADKKRF